MASIFSKAQHVYRSMSSATSSQVVGSYEDALKYLFATADYTGQNTKYKQKYPPSCLERMGELLNKIGRPQDSFKVVHITGTKGKGSTSAYSEALLRHMGNRTGLYTSPHLHSFRERIRVDGQLPTQSEIVGLISKLKPHFDSMDGLTVFEMMTAMAFQHYKDKQCNWAVVEVGMGGRLDSTNIVSPSVCAITNISLDHCSILGDTVEKIAVEKGGIIKPEAPVFVSEQSSAAVDTLKRIASDRGSPFEVVSPINDLKVGLQGPHQRLNASVAFEMVRNLASRGLLPSSPSIEDAEAAFSSVYWPGRCELMPGSDRKEGQARVIADCAHNGQSVEYIIDTVKELYPNAPLCVLFGANADKQVNNMLDVVAAQADEVYLAKSQHPKASNAADLAAGFPEKWRGSPHLHMYDGVDAALDAALKNAPKEGVILATGSVFVVPEVRQRWNDLYPESFPESDWVHTAKVEPKITP